MIEIKWMEGEGVRCGSFVVNPADTGRLFASSEGQTEAKSGLILLVGDRRSEMSDRISKRGKAML